jgi:hypothetical protein
VRGDRNRRSAISLLVMAVSGEETDLALLRGEPGERVRCGGRGLRDHAAGSQLSSARRVQVQHQGGGASPCTGEDGLGVVDPALPPQPFPVVEPQLARSNGQLSPSGSDRPLVKWALRRRLGSASSPAGAGRRADPAVGRRAGPARVGAFSLNVLHSRMALVRRTAAAAEVGAWRGTGRAGGSGMPVRRRRAEPELGVGGEISFLRLARDARRCRAQGGDLERYIHPAPTACGARWPAGALPVRAGRGMTSTGLAVVRFGDGGDGFHLVGGGWMVRPGLAGRGPALRPHRPCCRCMPTAARTNAAALLPPRRRGRAGWLRLPARSWTASSVSSRSQAATPGPGQVGDWPRGGYSGVGQRERFPFLFPNGAVAGCDPIPVARRRGRPASRPAAWCAVGSSRRLWVSSTASRGSPVGTPDW